MTTRIKAECADNFNLNLNLTVGVGHIISTSSDSDKILGLSASRTLHDLGINFLSDMDSWTLVGLDKNRIDLDTIVFKNCNQIRYNDDDGEMCRIVRDQKKVAGIEYMMSDGTTVVNISNMEMPTPRK